MGKDIKILDRHCFAEGVTIIEQGTEGSRAYIIESGRVEIFVKDPKGEKVVITELGPGALIGEIALVDDGLRTASVITLEPTVLVTISAHDFKTSLKKADGLQSNLTKIMQRRVTETLETLEKQRNPEKIRDNADKREVQSMLDKLKMKIMRLSNKI